MYNTSLSQQAKNSIKLYAGNPESKILQLLRIQGKSVVNEIIAYVGATDMEGAAVHLQLFGNDVLKSLK